MRKTPQKLYSRNMEDKAVSHGSWVVRFLKTQVSRLKSQDSFGFTLIRLPLLRKRSCQGFTLIELLVAITIIAVLSSVAFVAYSKSQALARDAKRKQDLAAIVSALEVYYNINKRYPQTSQPYGSNSYLLSTDGEGWIPGLVSSGIMTRIPIDPLNTGSGGPWNNNTYTYTYGNVSADGSSYDLTARLENTSDPDRCTVRVWYMLRGGVTGFPPNGISCVGITPYSGQIYEASPDR